MFHNPGRIVFWRGDRVADCAALEMLCTRKGTEGSNPSFSARFIRTIPNWLEGYNA